MKRCLFACLVLSTLVACDPGEKLENLPPETKLFVESINVSGDQRLNSVVRLHWSGEDQDGYVNRYEFAINNANWFSTTQTDSVFRFDINFGSDTNNIVFSVRAIDNLGQTDPTPAELVIPIKNTTPVAVFDTINVIPDTVFSVWSVLWAVEDVDGQETLDSVFIRINQGSWYALDRLESFVTFIPTQPEQSGLQETQIFSGQKQTILPISLEGLNVEGSNRLYLRVRDIAGSFSEIDSTDEFFVRAKKSDLLVVDDHTDPNSDNTYFPLLGQIYPGYDYLNIRENIPPFWDPTFGFMLGLYDKVFWYSDGTQLSAFGQQLLIEVASTQIQLYLNQGGKIFFTARFPGSFTDPTSETANRSPIFSFSPMDSLSTSPGQARIPIDSVVFPTAAFSAIFDPLVCSTFITGADPFYPKDPVNNLMTTNLVTAGGWVGPNVIAARTTYTNGKTNQVFVSVELHKLQKDPAALTKFMNFVLNSEFNW
ncbi:MAG: hypothetical protein SF052_24820 [Bacteroidia bacterium]|nr:hypothetical protein [Bacteroidia bacterium]